MIKTPRINQCLGIPSSHEDSVHHTDPVQKNGFFSAF